MSPYAELGVTAVLNAAGPVTRYGGSVLSARVLLPIDCEEDWPLERVAEAIGKAAREGACGTAYVFRTGDRGVAFEDWVRASHRHGLPALVDASVRLPPVENLRRIPRSGADLVAFSGGKAIQGPQNTGFLVGRVDLIRSVLLQNQDMDVNAETWFLRRWVEEGKIPRPPRNGIGRGLKVSKEGIVGLLAALEEYLARDHNADLMAWRKRVDEVCLGPREHPTCRAERATEPGGSDPVPVALLRLTEESRLTLVEFVNACARLPRPVLFEEGTLGKGYLVIHPMCLSDEDARELVRSVREVLKGSE